jgi:hypothetical protein
MGFASFINGRGQPIMRNHRIFDISHGESTEIAMPRMTPAPNHWNERRLGVIAESECGAFRECGGPYAQSFDG